MAKKQINIGDTVYIDVRGESVGVTLTHAGLGIEPN